MITDLYEYLKDPIIQGIITSIVIYLLLQLKKAIIDSHKLRAINVDKLVIDYVEPTMVEVGKTAVGMKMTFDLTVQNIGNKTAKIESIKFIIDQQKPFGHGLGRNITPTNWIAPGQLFTYELNEIINISEKVIGTLSFDIKSSIIPENGPISFFTIGVFNNPTHDSIQSMHIKDLISYNRIQSSILRIKKHPKFKKALSKLFKINLNHVDFKI